VKRRLYLDNCCFNRPYDDQSYLTIWLEAEAKLFIQKEILEGVFELAWSYMLDYENSMNPYVERRKEISKWRNLATYDIDFSKQINILGKQNMQKGLKPKDALHIACAISAGCHYFLTTDVGILKKHFEEIVVINPVDFVREVEALL
jgi:predicted nucleic acid-binding protein